MLTNFQNAFDTPFSVFDRLFEDLRVMERARFERWPRFELNRNDGALFLRAELPGVRKEDLKIELHEGILTVGGARASQTPQGYTAVRQERAPYRFEKRFELPEDLAVEQTEAKLENGVLTLKIPARPKAEPVKIEINS